MEQENFGKSDEEIVVLIQKGRIEFFEVLLKRYKDKIMRYSRKFLWDGEEINDIVQEIFIKTYTNIKSFDKKRKFSSWIYRIAHNHLVNFLKKKQRKILSFFEWDTFLPSSLYNKSLEEDLDGKEIQEMINKALNQLKPEYREPIILHYLEGFSYEEISEIMMIPISTVGVRINRAKAAMKLILNKKQYQ